MAHYQILSGQELAQRREALRMQMSPSMMEKLGQQNVSAASEKPTVSQLSGSLISIGLAAGMSADKVIRASMGGYKL